jgi:hypothetical protein
MRSIRVPLELTVRLAADAEVDDVRMQGCILFEGATSFLSQIELS